MYDRFVNGWCCCLNSEQLKEVFGKLNYTFPQKCLSNVFVFDPIGHCSEPDTRLEPPVIGVN